MKFTNKILKFRFLAAGSGKKNFVCEVLIFTKIAIHNTLMNGKSSEIDVMIIMLFQKSFHTFCFSWVFNKSCFLAMFQIAISPMCFWSSMKYVRQSKVPNKRGTSNDK